MAFTDTKSAGNIIASADWNDFVDFTQLISSNSYGHSSNKDLHFPSSQLLSWLNALYQESGTSATTDVAWSSASDFYGFSSNAKSLYQPSGTTQYLDDFYSSSMGAGLSGSYSTHRQDTTIHFTKSSLDDDYAGSSQIRTYINTISGALDTRIDTLESQDEFDHTLYSLSANLYNQTWIDTLSGSIDTRLDSLESQEPSSWSGASDFYGFSSNVKSDLTSLFNASTSLDSRIDTLEGYDIFDSSIYITSSNAIDRFADSSNYSSHKSDSTIHFNKESLDDDYYPSTLGYNISSTLHKHIVSSQIHYTSGSIKTWFDTLYESIGASGSYWSGSLGYIGHSSNKDIHYPSSNLVSWLNNEYLNKDNSTAFTPDGDYEPATKKYVDDTVAGAGGYTDEQAQDAVGDNVTSGLAYNDDAGAIYIKEYNTLSSQSKQGYLSGQKVKDTFDHTLYSLSSNIYNKSWIDSLSGSIDSRLDSLESQEPSSWSGSSGFYGFSSNVKEDITSLFNASTSLDSRIDTLEAQDEFDSSLYITSTNAISRFADSSNYSTHKADGDIHFPSSNLIDWLNSLYQESGTSIGSAWSGASEFYSFSSNVKDDLTSLYAFSTNASNMFMVSGTSEINELEDVDTQSSLPSRDQVLKWNGSNWVPASYDATFEFTIASFSDGQSTTQLIGTGVWKAGSAISFTASYNNGPPDNSDVYVGYNSTNYWKSGVVGVMDGADAESGDNDVAISYPKSKDQYVRFILSSNASTDKDTQTETAIYFRNYVYWGILNKNSSFSEADIESLAGSEITNDHTLSNKSVNVTAGNYLVVAHPASYTDLPTGDDYETDGGGTGFRFNGMTCAFETKETVSVTNSAGYTENYEVYGSKLSNLGNSSLYTYTSRTALNEVYYGVTSKTSGYDEADVEGLANSPITDDSTQTWSQVTAGVGEYLLFCFPKRWGEKGTAYTFYDNGTGFEASFEDAETVSVTNSQGWTEDFYVYRSENPNLGAITIRTS